jgi:excinuclease UvrABC nuclease subunit
MLKDRSQEKSQKGESEMEGPYLLNETKIDRYVSLKPGVYCLTYTEGDKNIACYVGRSDNELKSRLKDHLPENETDDCIINKRIDKFYFENTDTANAAYELECQWYHEYKPDCNDMHPDKTDPRWICPVCGQ